MKLKPYLQALRNSSLVACLKSSPAWFLAPAVVCGLGVGLAVASYEPLTFDPSQYETPTAQASELGDEVDAKAIEKKGKAAKAKANADEVAEAAASASAEASKLAAAKFADGSYTGYARCTEHDIFDYYLKLTVVVKDGKVAAIRDIAGSATGNAGSKQLEPYDSVNDTYIAMARGPVTSQILKVAKAGKVASDIDVVSGATYSSNSILAAYLDALSKSAAKAGNEKSAAQVNAKKDEASKKPASGSDDDAADETPDDGAGDNGSGDDSGNDGADDAPDAPQIDYGTGEFTGYALCRNAKVPSAYAPYYIGVTVKTLDGHVDSVVDIFGDDKGVVDPSHLYDAAENSYYLERALNGYGISGKHPGLRSQLDALIAAGKSDGEFDTISGATYSSKSIVEAYRVALGLAAQSAAGAGGDVATNGEGE